MRSRRHLERELLPILLIVTALLVGPSVGSSLAGSDVPKLREVTCQNSEVVLTIAAGRVSIGNTDISVTTRLYNGGFPGPVIRMKAGKTCNVLLVNNLTGTTETDCDGHHNGFHCPDHTNLHTHGLHVTPRGNGDNVNVTVRPQERFRYSYNLKSDVLMGTHWYHPHRHGSTTLQTVGGAFGVLLVDPADSYVLPSDLKKLYDEANVFAMNDFDFRTDDGSNQGYVKSWMAISNIYPVQSVKPNLSIGTTTNPHFVAVNGQYQPFLTVTQNKVFLIRFLWASGTRPLELKITSGPECQMLLLARDGVFHRTPYLSLPSITMLQGGRADIAFRCSSAGVTTFSAVPLPENEGYFGGHITNERIAQSIVFQFKVLQAAVNAPVEAFPTSSVTFPSYLQDLQTQPISRAFELHMSGALVFTPDRKVLTSPGLGVNGLAWQGWEHPHWTEHLCLEETYEIQIDGQHPYHQHINHFQIYKTSAPPHVVRPGEFRDVTLGGTNLTKEVVRMRTHEYDGVYILHCHIVEHEDAGLMGGYFVSKCGSSVVETTASSTKQKVLPVSVIISAIATIVTMLLLIALAIAFAIRRKNTLKGYHLSESLKEDLMN